VEPPRTTATPRPGALWLGTAAILVLTACDKPKPRHPPPPTHNAVAEPTPPAPAWARELLDRPLVEAFPNVSGQCLGNTDAVAARYAGDPRGVKIVGWGWDPAAKKAVGRVILVGVDGRIAGAGESGQARPDVAAAVPQVTALDSGWAADVARTKGPLDAYGVVDDGRALCRLGHLEF
jgi:hypothetical protein